MCQFSNLTLIHHFTVFLYFLKIGFSNIAINIHLYLYYRMNQQINDSNNDVLQPTLIYIILNTNFYQNQGIKLADIKRSIYCYFLDL